MGLNLSAARTPCHGVGGSGACQRKSPTGGAANGMPLKTRTSGFVPAMPVIKPASSRTGSLIAAERVCAARMQAASAENFMGFIGAMLKRIHTLRQRILRNGARYRVRTCDPYSVNVVLYH